MSLVAEALPLVNEALVLLGERPFVSFTDPTTQEQRRAVEAVYETTYKSVVSRLCPARFQVSIAYTTAVTLPRTPGSVPTDPTLLTDFSNSNSDKGRAEYPLAFAPTVTAQTVALPTVLTYLEMMDTSGYPLLDWVVGYGGVILLPAEYTAGAVARVLVRPPESLLDGPLASLFSAELACKLAVRLGAKEGTQQNLRQQAALRWREVRHGEVHLRGSRGDFLVLNPHDKTDSGDSSTWLTARF